MINTILVIDDNTLDNAILRNTLYNEHYNIIYALTSHEALALLESRNVDLILIDMVMPVMDSFLNEFSKMKYYHTIPVIMITSTDKTDIIEKMIGNFEIFDYIIKPFDNIKSLDNINHLIFVNKIRTAISYRKAVRELTELKNKNEGDGR